MFETGKVYKRGGRTHLYIFVKYTWWIFLFAVLSGYLAYEIYFGRLRTYVESFLNDHKDWYIDVTMLSEWILILSFGFLIICYLRTKVMFNEYKFVFDDHAFHLRKGLFMIREINIPYYQVSNVHIIRPYFFRFLGLAQLDIVSSADRNHATDYLIPVIDATLAKQISGQLLKYASQFKKGENTNRETIENEDEDEDGGEDFSEDVEDGEEEESDIEEEIEDDADFEKELQNNLKSF